MTNSDCELESNRPPPITSDIDVLPFNIGMNPQIAIDALVNANYVLISDYYSSGLTVLRSLKDYLQNRHLHYSYIEQREFSSIFHNISGNLILFIKNHKLTVKKAPDIGWLSVLYPELDEFALPFTQVQGLNSSWQWFSKGIKIPGLVDKIHPWVGTYFPTRFDHLILFDHWLKLYRGPKENAYDIGIGSGVLTFLLMKHGFKKVFGTDSNPNVIIGLRNELSGNKNESKIDLLNCDLFGNKTEKSELIIFNPPWMPSKHNSEGIDNAIYYTNNLFPRFFSQAYEHLAIEGKIAIIFSNLAQITGLIKTNPIEIELSNNLRFKKIELIQKGVPPASDKTKRDLNWRSSEVVELWILEKIAQ